MKSEIVLKKNIGRELYKQLKRNPRELKLLLQARNHHSREIEALRGALRGLQLAAATGSNHTQGVTRVIGIGSYLLEKGRITTHLADTSLRKKSIGVIGDQLKEVIPTTLGDERSLPYAITLQHLLEEIILIIVGCPTQLSHLPPNREEIS